MEIRETYINLSEAQVRDIHRYMATIIGAELAGISSACYVPKAIKFKNDFMAKCGITPRDIKKFMHQFDPTYAKFSMFNDEFTVALLMLTLYFSRIGNAETSKFAYLLLSIKFYSSLLHISFPKFCNDELWRLALAKVSPKHLFREKNGISNALLYLVNIMFQKHGNKISTASVTDFEVVRLTFEMRGRLSQSIKSFAETYYALQKKGSVGVGGQETVDESDGIQIIADKISMSMCTFEQIDDKNLEFAINKSGIRREIAESLIDELSSVEYKDQIRFIIILLGKISPIKNICKESGRLALVRRIESGATVGHYVVRDEILKVLFSTELGFRLKSMNRSQLVIFFSHYISKYIQLKIC